MTETIRDIRQQPFYWIDRDFLQTHGARIGPNGIAVYNALVFRSNREGRAWPGLADLMALTGIKSKTTLRRTLATLEAAKLVKINTRFNGVRYETNEYLLLPTVGQEMTQVVQEMTQGGSFNDPPLVQQMTQVVQEMTHPGSLNDTEQQSYNNNHEQQSNNNNKQQACMLPAAAADLLLENSVDVQKINGQGINLAAWIVYARTQKGLRNPVGYAMTRIKRNEPPGEVFTEIVSIDIDWPDLLRYARYEQLYRQNPGTQGLELYEDLETVSDDAIAILNELREAPS